MFTFICVSVGMLVPWYMNSQKTALGVSSCLPPCLRQGLFFPPHCVCQDNELQSLLPTLCASLELQTGGHTTVPGFLSVLKTESEFSEVCYSDDCVQKLFLNVSTWWCPSMENSSGLLRHTIWSSLFVLSSCLLYSVGPLVLPLPSVSQVSNALCHLLCIPRVSQC